MILRFPTYRAGVTDLIDTEDSNILEIKKGFGINGVLWWVTVVSLKAGMFPNEVTYNSIKRNDGTVRGIHEYQAHSMEEFYIKLTLDDGIEIK